jgi:glycine/D-amino acid oxidase-like deaminating enzyme
VLKIEQLNGTVDVTVKHHQLHEEIAFRARRVAVCTNAFTRSFYPEIDVEPGRGMVLITKPIPDIRFKGIYHFDKGYYYFRNLNNRLLFGGGRNMDFEGERTTDFSLNQHIQKDLISKISEIILPGTAFEIEDWWTGIMAFGASKRPILIKQSTGIYLGVRMGGMGVAIGSEMGERLATLICKEY